MTEIEELKIYPYVIQVADDEPFGQERLITHYPQCWKTHGRCATAKLEELLTLLSMSKKKIDRDELIKVIQG